MALTPYNGLAPTISGAPNIVQAGLSLTVAVSGNGLWDVGDFFVIAVNTDGTVDPTSIVSTVGALAFTKLFGANGTSFWICKNTTGAAQYSPGATVTYAAATAWGNYTIVIVTNSSGFTNTAGTSAASTAQNTDIHASGTIASTIPQSLLLGMIGTKKTSAVVHSGATLASQHGKPASIGAYGFTNQTAAAPANGLATIIGASLGERALPSGVTYDFAAWDTSATGAVASAGIIISFQPDQISLDDNTLQFDNGPLLNNPSAALPLYDIDTIVGLSDMDVTNDSNPIDGTPGAYVSAKFASGKTVVIDGTAYSATSPFDEGLLDTLKQVLAPKANPIPLYYKPANKNPRVLQVYPVAFKADITRARSLSQCPYEIQALTADATALSLADTAVYSADAATSSTATITVTGSTETYPVIYFNVYAADTGAAKSFTFYNNNWGFSQRPFLPSTFPLGVKVDLTSAVAGMYKLDLKARMLWRLDTVGQVDVSNLLTIRSWWTLEPNQPNQVTMLRTNSGEGFTVAGSEAWL